MLRHKRVTFSLSVELIKLLNELVANSKKSGFVEKAIFEYVKKIKETNLKNRLRAGYLATAEEDAEIAEEFYPLEQESYQEYVLNEEVKNERKI